MTEAGEVVPDGGGRLKGVTLVKPIVYGNVARYFGQKREKDGHTHSWNLYVRPYKNDDMSLWVKKVSFKLHDSYTNPTRVITKPPFQVEETGWGEFEVAIKIYFQDMNERPITIYHVLKLFETDPINKTISVKKTLVSEFYDEIVFQDPSSLMQSLLTSTPSGGTVRHETDFEDKKERNLTTILNAKSKVRHEINDLKERLRVAQEAIDKFRQDIATTENV